MIVSLKQMQTKEYFNVIDKSKYECGPWLHEPDKKQWFDLATGLPCLIVRACITGALCGYVGVPKHHQLYEVPYGKIDSQDISIHGGLTFSDKCQNSALESNGICHKVEEGAEDDVWWLGFDCSHYDDICPGFWHVYKDIAIVGTYRDFKYVENQVLVLAEQLNEITWKGLT